MTSLPTQRFLAEWHPQEAVLLAWPFPQSDWQPWLEPIQKTYVELARAVSETATPVILCQDAAHQQAIITQLGPQLVQKVRLVQCAYNDTWCRDYGPLALGGQDAVDSLVSFQFTGWGDKYESANDNLVNAELETMSAWRVPLSQVALELEGGAIDTDGQGTLLTTEACLLAGNRNQSMDRMDVEAALIRFLGVNRVIWLQEGYLIGDDTDSHVDNLVRFANPQTLVYACCDRPEDPHFGPLKAMEAEVKSLLQANGEPYQCLPLMIPEALHDENGTRLPASYVNFLILNDTVIVPVFGSPYDSTAMQQLAQAFPEHRLIPVDGRQLIKQYGGPHCATMQLPQNTMNPTFLGERSC
ncbi:MAG: agmatine deiminase family protein [Ketobacteraceae bacterium]|nr:agmatine deiminase family protein [Ketobacteraceae bacterium]